MSHIGGGREGAGGKGDGNRYSDWLAGVPLIPLLVVRKKEIYVGRIQSPYIHRIEADNELARLNVQTLRDGNIFKMCQGE